MPNFEFAHLEKAPVIEVTTGIRMRPLWENPDVAKALVVEIDAGACFEEVDVHSSGPELVYVLDGVFCDGTDRHPAGTFIYGPKGSSHIPQSDVGCTVLVLYPLG
ncbi:cupin domain-containing protein [Streptomyces sp. NPDC007205]|uniref:cupin domain-containing protein n=1 Tax=Streptomyces sp. NPDC007205 TaxID=3154316 RepID=UPI0033CB684F